MNRIAPIIAAVVVVGVLAGVGVRLFHPAPTGQAASVGPIASPPGITTQPLLIAGPDSNTVTIVRGVVYADESGKTLYRYGDAAADEAGCSGDCMKGWKPALATGAVASDGHWSTVKRDDGSLQWALNGRRLFTFDGDQKPSDTKGEGASGKWRAASVAPSIGGLPDKIAIHEVLDASGQVLVDARGMTLYELAGELTADEKQCLRKPCLGPWEPVSAPQIASPTGDFSIVARPDGTTQWAFRGHGLYRFKGDVEIGDANGVGVDARFQPAAVVRYFLPEQVALTRNIGRGIILTTKAGMTLYRRDGHRIQNSGHSLRHGPGVLPSFGRAIGPQACDRECTKTWHPLVAPAGARSRGYWDVVQRDDGARQWAYKGFPLYTFEGDKKPGDMTGNDTYDFLTNDGIHKVSLPDLPMLGAAALYWSYTWP